MFCFEWMQDYRLCDAPGRQLQLDLVRRCRRGRPRRPHSDEADGERDEEHSETPGRRRPAQVSLAVRRAARWHEEAERHE